VLALTSLADVLGLRYKLPFSTLIGNISAIQLSACHAQEDSEVWLGEFDFVKMDFVGNEDGKPSGAHFHLPRCGVSDRVQLTVVLPTVTSTNARHQNYLFRQQERCLRTDLLQRGGTFGVWVPVLWVLGLWALDGPIVKPLKPWRTVLSFGCRESSGSTTTA